MENHAVCIPFPAQGHIRPMLKLAQLLHFKFGFHITFINTHYIHQTFFKNYHLSSENTTPMFKFESFPQDHDDEEMKDMFSVISSIVNNNLENPLKKLLNMSKLCSSGETSGRAGFTCMISDVGMSSFTIRVAEEMGIPAVLLETASACGLLAYYHYRQLLDKGIIPLPDKNCLTNGYLEKAIDWIPSLKGICLKDMPTFVRTTDPNDILFNIIMLNAQRALSCRAILINTFDALEQDVLMELSTISSNIYPIGPLHLMVDHQIPKSNHICIGPDALCDEGDRNGYEYMKWLDLKEPKSVLYVSFGSIVGVTQETFNELAWGLANSHVKFMWIIRSDLVIGERDSFWFDQFKREISGRGVTFSWCDQEQVLAHPSIGGFLTHCGWNSMIESLSHGVPFICWPFVAEQVTNSWYFCTRLGIGVKMSQEIKRDEVERVVKELMEAEKRNEIRTKAKELGKKAREAIISPLGSSYINLKNVIDNILTI